ncbi:GNAT family N-acetyltransferase [Sphingomonas sp.]|uniref:GNAT family N-acetyltransferase n=1 Tax=Sphingomonas sp. TaxID=28214 RepID=UPI003B3A3128
MIEALAARSIRALHAGAYDDAIINEAIDHAYGVDWQLVRDGTYFVAAIAGSVVGAGGWSYRQTIAGAHGPDDPPANLLSPVADAARIRAFYVDPDYARRGVGVLLLSASERAALDMGFTRAELTATLPAVPFYAAYGYEPAGRYDLALPSGRLLELRLMTKRLILPA